MTTNTTKGTTNSTNNAGTMKTDGLAASTLVAGRDVKDFTLTPSMVDVRGWEVFGPGGVKIGFVDRIMLDRTEMKPRYLRIALLERNDHLLLPIGIGTLDPAQKRLLLDSMPPETLKAIPVLAADVVTHDFERRVYGAVTGKKDTSSMPGQWYADPVFDPKNLMTAKA
jgi:hypothetical protein